MELNPGLRRVDVDDETLVLDPVGGRVVRLRGAARHALDGDRAGVAAEALDHLRALGVIVGPSGPAGSGTDSSGPGRRAVLTAAAAAALGVTVLPLPASGAAASPGSESVAFAQVAEFPSPASTAPSGSLYRSFVYDGKIHLLDPSASPWRMYVFTSSLDAVEVVSITGVTSATASDWLNDSSDFILDGTVATLAVIRIESSTPYLEVVRLSLPLTPVSGSVAATFWQVDLTARFAAESQVGRSWTLNDGYGGTQTVDGSSLDVYGGGTVSSISWSTFQVKPVGSVVVSGGELFALLLIRSSEEFQTTYTADEASRTPRFYFWKYELIGVNTTTPSTVTYDLVNIDLVITSFSGERPSATGNISTFSPFAAVLDDGDLVLVANSSVIGGESLDVARVPLADPSTWTVSTDIAKPTGYGLMLPPSPDRARPAFVRIGDTLMIPIWERTSGMAAVVALDLTTSAITDQVSIPSSQATFGPIASDGTYLYVVFSTDTGAEAVARLTTGPLAWDSTALTAQGSYAALTGYTAQPTASGVLVAGTGAGAIGAFA